MEKDAREVRQRWEACGNGLFDRIRQPSAVLRLEPLDLAPRLRDLAVAYLLTLPGEKPPTRGSVLNELQDLLTYEPKSVVRHLKTLSGDAVRAMFRHFPAPMMEFSDIDDYKNVFLILGHGHTLEAAWKSRTAHRFGVGGDGVFRASGWSAQTPPIEEETLPIARSDLETFFREDPALFLRHLAFTVDLLLDGFQVRGLRGGRNTSLTAGVFASSDWRLAQQVADLIWPTGRGQMVWSEIVATRTIIEATKVFAYESQRRALPTRIDIINRNIVSDVLTLRHQIDSLNDSIRFVETRKLALQHDANWSEPQLRRWRRISDTAFFPLLDWRRELERRLRAGDYRPANTKILRPTGPILRTPTMPKFTPSDGLLKRTLMLIAAARPLRPLRKDAFA